MGPYLLHDIRPGIVLIRRDGDVQRVRGRDGARLVDEAARHVQQVARLQLHLQHWLRHFLLSEVPAGSPR